MDDALTAALDAAPPGSEASPVDGDDTVRRWLDGEGVRPGAYAAATAGQLAELCCRWALARGWTANVTPSVLARVLRARGFTRCRPGRDAGAVRGRLYRVAGRARAAQLREAARALTELRTGGVDARTPAGAD